jgi:NADPH-dependent F420 reductase
LSAQQSDLPTIALIGGTGNLGPGLALRWAHAGYKVLIGSRLAKKAKGVAKELNKELGENLIAGFDNAAAVVQAEICALTVVQAAHEAALVGLKDNLQGKLLIDATARLDFPNLTPPPPPAAARLGQNMLGPSVRVVAAFQNVPAATLRKNWDQPLDSDILVCADDLEAAETVIKLAQAAGMQAYYAGGLDGAVTVEGITSLLVAMNRHYKAHAGTIRVAGMPREK